MEAFNVFDKDTTGEIDVWAIKVVIKALGYEPSKEEIKRILATVDKDGTGRIDFEGFLTVFAIKMAERDSDDEIMKSFQLFDDNCTGVIVFDDLRRAAEELGENLTDEEIQEMIVEADINTKEETGSHQAAIHHNDEGGTFHLLNVLMSICEDSSLILCELFISISRQFKEHKMAFESHSQRDANGSYTFSSRPRPVENRSKYREPPPEQMQNYGNIMYDRRVVRGNTYAQHIIPTMVQPDPAETQRQQEIRRRAIARKRAREQFRSGTPEALQGRKHIDVQTELYLEELSDIIVATDIECQTDAFLDKPATPLFIPAKSGKDYVVKLKIMYPLQLFDFDVEVQPLLEVLVGKTIEQSLEEVMEEEELASLRAQQRAFRELRKKELAEVHQLQEQERRRTEEKGHRIAQQREVLKKEREVAEKIAARAYTQQYLADLLPTVFTSLRNHGYFYDPVEKDIETNFLPWLMVEVNNSLERRYTARAMLDTIIHDVAQKRLEGSKEPETQPAKPETQ
ncbi:Radial spoke head protein 3-like protein [Nibea albiflora]|uniref:Radial spoke head protein 3-like protein n=1 Tax=Nibea albiflora TaxID=240163 RepID=A0ACB7FAM9_NIBAL|nr:Radial spoke head protein 3-like protein [Nibea albiflora]